MKSLSRKKRILYFKRLIHPCPRCAENFSCQDPTESVHFKFDRFDTESGYDYLVIGSPKSNQLDDYYYMYYEYIYIPADQNGLILDGSQQTGIWVNAQSIPLFNIYFYRHALRSHL